jgi:hypothetical protein
MIGDAATFIDPVFSSGLFLSMACGLLAADSILAALAGGDLVTHPFADYDAYFTRATTTFRMFLDAFYDPLFSARTLVREHPEWVDDWGRILQGDVFEENRPFLRFLIDYRTGLARDAGEEAKILIPDGWDDGAVRPALRLPPPLDLSERVRRRSDDLARARCSPPRPSGSSAAPFSTTTTTQGR